MRPITRSSLTAAALVGVMALMWILLVPPQAGPDERDHLVRGGALVRGELEGQEPPYRGTRVGFELPAWVDKPNPDCYKFEPGIPVECSTSTPLPEGERVLGTRAIDYQLWGHLLPGLGTYAPSSVSLTLSRMLDAMVPVAALGVVFAVAARRGWLALGASVLAVTPMAWFMFAVVNPSGLVIAGGLLMWTALVAAERAPPRLQAWMVAIGWAMMTLPRRDGLVWAVLGLSIALLVLQRGFLDTWRSLGLWPQVVLAGSTVATLLWAVTSDSNDSMALLVAPLVPVVAALARRAWYAPWMASTGRRITAVAVALVVAGIGTLVVMDQRRSGFDRGALRNAILRTGEDVREAVGHLGWLDTPLPETLLFFWMVMLGLLVAAAVVADARRLVFGAIAVLLVAIHVSWTLTMLQNQPESTYWQGRYYLPLLVGIPVLLGSARIERAASDRLGRIVLVGGLVVANVALGAAVRRWADGVAGTLLPWEWDTYDTVLPPILLLAVHAGASFGLWRWACHELAADAPAPQSEPRPGTPAESSPGAIARDAD